jgi:2-iminobutanoate/2-iminopropanoate deaminase
MLQTIEVPGLPANNKTYSQAVVLGDMVFVSGQLGVDPATGKLVDGGIAEETRQALANVATVLEAAGSSLARVAKVTIFIQDFSWLPAMNAVYGPLMAHRPAKTTVEISRLDKNAAIEIEVIAG